MSWGFLQNLWRPTLWKACRNLSKANIKIGGSRSAVPFLGYIIVLLRQLLSHAFALLAVTADYISMSFQTHPHARSRSTAYDHSHSEMQDIFLCSTSHSTVKGIPPRVSLCDLSGWKVGTWGEQEVSLFKRCSEWVNVNTKWVWGAQTDHNEKHLGVICTLS